jgi:predicted Zn-dependent protease with MMP-like domain
VQDETNDDFDDNGELPEELWDTLDELYELAEDDPEEAYETFQAFPKDVREHRVFQMALAGLEKFTDRGDDAKARLLALLDKRPDDADVHHQLGDLLEDMGDSEGANRHFILTRKYDLLRPTEAKESDYDRVEKAAAELIAELPDIFRKKLKSAPILVEARPSEELVEEGLDPRSMGLFEGPRALENASVEAVAAPTRIVIYAENIAREVGTGPEYDDEVRITLLHELGHYFGLEEEDMARLGLD